MPRHQHPFVRLARRTAGALLLTTVCATAAHTQEPTYLFGLEESEILSILDTYRGRGNYDARTELGKLVEPFDCARVPALCREIGRDYAYLVLESMWTAARRGASLERILVDAELQVDGYSDRAFELSFPQGALATDAYFGSGSLGGPVSDCVDDVTFDESGNFRLRQVSAAADAGFASLSWARAKLFRKTATGRYRGERADRIRVDVDFFVTGVLGPEKLERSKEKTNDRAVLVAFPAADFNGALSAFHTESCGSVLGPVSLETCACTGARPAAYQGL